MYIGRHEINKNSYNLEYDLEHDLNILTDTMFPLYGDFLDDVLKECRYETKETFIESFVDNDRMIGRLNFLQLRSLANYISEQIYTTRFKFSTLDENTIILNTGSVRIPLSKIWIANEDIKWYIWKQKKNKKILEIE